ncbi:ArsR/SmtB family transcription factor [Cellulomonas aerilata]|uniref:Transcriptional regulator n=1 Tax=Cellulomonas aerilata TaxID=515326 RepID=A0A512D7V2_9CELL|nr:helix-turn-helix domain-containing protein [Cellulomonas aerilata]GEO32556.1 transcriptional regulator [Cellulomonas aerilata]
MQMSVGNSGSEPASAGPPQLDASGLKAYAHPLRLQMIRYLNDHGPATATQLARHLGESTGQTSYHLRQLARHGLVEDDPGRGTGRERWWRSRSFQVHASQLSGDPALGPAAQAVLSSVAQSRSEALDRWMAVAQQAPPEWMEAALHSQSTLRLTPEEARDLHTEVLAVLERFAELGRGREAGGHGDRVPPDAAGDDAPSGGAEPGPERVRVYVDVFPLWAERDDDR